MYSGLLVCSIVGQVVDYRSMGKSLSLFDQVTHQTPIVDARGVRERIIAFKNHLSQCQRYNVGGQSEAQYMGLERMMKELVCRLSMTIHLAGVREVIAQRRGDGAAMLRAMWEAAGDLYDLKASAALPPTGSGYGPPRTNRFQQRKTNDGAFAIQDSVCLAFREYGEINVKMEISVRGNT